MRIFMQREGLFARVMRVGVLGASLSSVQGSFQSGIYGMRMGTSFLLKMVTARLRRGEPATT